MSGLNTRSFIPPAHHVVFLSKATESQWMAQPKEFFSNLLNNVDEAVTLINLSQYQIILYRFALSP